MADPPYWNHYGDRDHLAEIFESGLLPSHLADDGWFIAEASSKQNAHEPPGWQLADRRTYGSSALWLYQKEEGT